MESNRVGMDLKGPGSGVGTTVETQPSFLSFFGSFDEKSERPLPNN